MKGGKIKELGELQELLKELYDAIRRADTFQLWLVKNILQDMVEEIQREQRRREIQQILGIDIIDSERGP